MSQESPIVNAVKSLQAKLDAMNMRERLLVVATAMLVIGTAWYVGLVEPDMKESARVRTDIEAARESINSINQSMEMQALQASSTMAGEQEQLALLQQRLDELNDRLAGYKNELISPAEMSRVLQGVLQKQDNLQLVSVTNLSPEALTGAGEEEVIFYKHGLAIEFEGGYFACLEYLEQIEALPWRFYWQVLELQVLEYPRNRIRLEVSTLSPYQEWIGA